MIGIWSDWQLFPDPREGEYLVAPFGAGCYEFKLAEEKILFGHGGHVALRLTSLLPKPEGSGARNNDRKRAFVFMHLGTIEFRTIAFSTRDAAKACEAALKASGGYRFTT